MMYGSLGWGWIGIAVMVLLLLILCLLIVQTVRLFGAGPADGADTPTSRPSPGSARRIAEERLARGEISPEDFAQIVRALEQSI